MSQHPLAKAVVDYAHQNGAQKVDVSNFQSVTGKGAYAEIDGMTTYIGSHKLGTGTFCIARSNVTASGNLFNVKESLSWRLSQVLNLAAC